MTSPTIATLLFNQAKAGIYAGNISVTGALVKNGAGVLSLGGSNSYSGGTLVSAGTLSGTTASLQGSITNKATLAFHQSGSGTFSGNISVTGKLAVTGAGTVTLAGSNSFTGGTTVSLGTLAASSLGSGPLIISPTKRLTVGFTDTLENGTLSLGALALNGGAEVTISNPYGSIASTEAISIYSTNNFLDLEGAWTNLGTYGLLTGTKIACAGVSTFDLTGSFNGGAIIAPNGSATYDGLTYSYISNTNSLLLTIQHAQSTPAIERLTEEQIGGISSDPISVQAVPEPSTWLLLVTGTLLSCFGYKKNRRLS